MNISKWKFQNQKEIEEIIQKEGIQHASQFVQISNLLIKINISMINYLLNECKGYNIQFGQYCFTQFQYIKTIAKNGEIIFESEKIIQDNYKCLNFNIMNFTRKFQLTELAKLIKEEKRICFEFNDDINCFELVSFRDNDRNELSLIEFINKYEKLNELNEQNSLLFKEKYNFIDVKVLYEKSKWLFQNPEIINQIIINENYEKRTMPAQEMLIIKKLTISMMYYLLTECKGYKFSLNKSDQRNQLFEIYK